MENKFVDGFYYNEPDEKTPSFILARLSFNKARFLTWLDNQVDDNGYVKVDVLRSKDGSKIYATLNDWKPKR